MPKDYLICVLSSYFKGIGPVTFKKLINYFGSYNNFYEAKFKDLSSLLGDRLAKNFSLFKADFKLDRELQYCKKEKIEIVPICDDRYPKLLREISDPPICLFVKGDVLKYRFDKIHIGVVGTRKPTDYGQVVVKKITRELVEAQAAIVSGLAIGVDAIAHEEALLSQGSTVAVLGCGVNVVYPKENRVLYEKILDSGGLIVSEFPPDTFSLKGHFVARNRIISGISNGTLIIEGLRQSGSLITARYALEQGRDVFAPPCPITSMYSYAPNLMLKEGAKLVTDGSDILSEYGINSSLAAKKVNTENLSEIAKTIITNLQKEPMTVDELAANMGIAVKDLQSELMICELALLIEKNSSGRYQLII